MIEKGKIIRIEDFKKTQINQIDEDVSKISKDEFTMFRVNKGRRVLEKLYIQGKYVIDDLL